MGQLRVHAVGKLTLRDISEGASFASWKLDMITILVADPDLRPGDVRVAIVLLQAMNAKTGMIFPSQQTIAELACMTDRNVQFCIGKLKEAGWLTWSRGNRQLANSYSFSEKNVERVQQRLADLRRARRRRHRHHAETKPISPQGHVLTGSLFPATTRSVVPLETRSALPSNTSVEHHHRTQDNLDEADRQDEGQELDDLIDEYLRSMGEQ